MKMGERWRQSTGTASDIWIMNDGAFLLQVWRFYSKQECFWHIVCQPEMRRLAGGNASNPEDAMEFAVRARRTL